MNKPCQPCEPKNCPILYGLFIQDNLGSLKESIKDKLLGYYKLGMKIKELHKKEGV